jgi:hypothetical protein
MATVPDYYDLTKDSEMLILNGLLYSIASSRAETTFLSWLRIGYMQEWLSDLFLAVH